MTKREYIKKVRIDAGLTQKEAAEIIGITQGNLSTYETGYKNISPTIFFDILKAYKLDFSKLKLSEILDL